MTERFNVPLRKGNFLFLCSLLLFLIASATSIAGTRDFTFERSNPEYKKLITAISPRIQDVEADEDYFLAALLSEKLLSDYEGAIKYLKTFTDEKGEFVRNWDVAQAGRMLARYHAHIGNFVEAEKWLEKSQQIWPHEFWYKKTKEEIERCHQWIPILQQRIKTYRKAPSADNCGDIVRVYMELDEYGRALASMKQMRKEYPNDQWFNTKEFIYFHDFLTSYITAKKPQEEWSLPKLIEKFNPQVAVLFQELHKIETDKWKFCQKKWESMSTIEKVQFVNQYSRQAPPKGLNWEPTEEEAEEFLKHHRLVHERRRRPENVSRAYSCNFYLGRDDWEAEMIDMVYNYVKKEEKAPFYERQSAAISKIAAIGKDAIPDLIATLQGPAWPTPEGYEEYWATKTLSKMGKIALPALSAEFEATSKPAEAGRIDVRKLRQIARAIAGMKDPSTIPILRKALGVSDRDVRWISMDGLDEIEGGLTEDLLLELWQDGDYYIREHTAEYLVKYGSEKTIEALQKDLPTAYAQAAFEINTVLWCVKKRLGQTPGPVPERPRASKSDRSALWVGIEKSLKSPNPGIRITALETISERTKDTESIQSFSPIARKDPLPEVRSAAVEAAGKAFARFRDKASSDTKVASALQSIFHELIQIAMAGDDTIKTKVLEHSNAYLIYKDDEYFSRLIELIIKGMQSENMEYKANSIFALARIFSNREDLIEKYLTKEVRPRIAKVIVNALDSKYGRVKVDAISAVEILKIKAAQEKLLQIALNDEAHHRDHALSVLEVVGDASCIPILAEIAKKDPHVDGWGLYMNREQAWQTIKALSGKR